MSDPTKDVKNIPLLVSAEQLEFLAYVLESWAEGWTGLLEEHPEDFKDPAKVERRKEQIVMALFLGQSARAGLREAGR